MKRSRAHGALSRLPAFTLECIYFLSLLLGTPQDQEGVFGLICNFTTRLAQGSTHN